MEFRWKVIVNGSFTAFYPFQVMDGLNRDWESYCEQGVYYVKDTQWQALEVAGGGHHDHLFVKIMHIL